MEEVLLAILSVAVIGLAIRVSRLSDARGAVAELVALTRRLEQRLLALERQFALQLDNAAARKHSPASVPEPAPFLGEAPSPEFRVADADFAFPGANNPTSPAAPPPPRPKGSLQPASTPAARSITIEERLGQNWLSKIGVVLVVLGIATFLGYKLVTLGPFGKSLTGLASAIILLAGGLFLERMPNYRVFARAAIGGGWALLFFTTFALYHVAAMQVLTSQTVDLILMAVVAGAIVWHSLRYKSQVVTALAFLLAFATVGISQITLFSLVTGALLAVALVAVAAREFWFELGLAGLLGVYGNHFLWLLRVLPGGGQNGPAFPDLVPSVGLLLLYWFLFRLFYILRIPQDSRQQLFTSLTAVLNSAGLLALLRYQSSRPDWAFYVLVVLGFAELLFAFVARKSNRPAFLVLSTLASVLLLASIPFRFSGPTWTLLWLFEAEALFMAGVFIGETVLRRIGLLAGLATALQLFLTGVLPVFGHRLFVVDTANHDFVVSSLIAAALLFWFNSEYAGSRWQELFANALDDAALTLTSWMACAAMTAAVWLWAPGTSLSVVWGIFGVALFEAGTLLGRSRLRHQSYAVFAAAFLRTFVSDLNFGVSARDHHITTVLLLAGGYIWTYHRTHTALAGSVSDRTAGTLAAWSGFSNVVALLYLELRPEFVLVGWSLLAFVLVTVAWLVGRQTFTAQALALLTAAVLRALFYNLLVNVSPHNSSWSARARTVSIACAIMLLCLPAAFAIRRRARSEQHSSAGVNLWQQALARPEQPFFFAAYGLLAMLIACELRTGMITLGWIALGLAAFLGALPLGERSYRLGGLGLLLFGLGKIVFVDIWSLSTTDRILTLIVTGAVLLLVSFLYSRYRGTILKFL